MYILGIGGFSHDSAACLVRDGDIVAAAEEERFTRKKHQGGIPNRAVEFCLGREGISKEELDYVAVYMKPFRRLLRRLPYRVKQMARSVRYSTAYILYEFVHNAEYIIGSRSLLGNKTRLVYCDHHTAHAASAFFLSPFEDAALLSIDYIGEWTATYLGSGEGNRIRRFQEIRYPHSLGVVYSALTDFLGFVRANDEYKVMGLASYGDPERYKEVFEDMLRVPPGGPYQVNLDYFQYHYLPGSRLGYVSKKLIDVLGPPRQKGEAITQRHKDVAAALQSRTEEVVLDIVRHLHSLSGKAKNLCLAGGVALNCVMNGRVLSEGPFERVFVQPAAGDDGIAVGSALLTYYHILGSERKVPRTLEEDSRLPWGAAKATYLGPEYGEEDIKDALDIAKSDYRREEHPERVAARLIAEGKIVGWFQGRMEFGPRALGNRSILADPTRDEMKDLLNHYVKHREDFRPFAPSVCLEDVDRFFVPHRESRKGAESPFMLLVYDVESEGKSLLPAITHVDGTARVQTVRHADNPLYYELIREFERLRGVPVVLNTSFNIRGEPIVATPFDAIRCFFSTGIDALVIGPFVVEKKHSA